jgi:hypothetical protein
MTKLVLKKGAFCKNCVKNYFRIKIRKKSIFALADFYKY